MSPLEQAVLDAFGKDPGGSPTVVARAPGRVELLGNHTDYNGGLVLAVAIDRFTVVAGRRRDDRAACFRSVNFGADDTFPLDSITPGDGEGWGRYVEGVVWSFRDAYGPLAAGVDAAIAGDVPLGGGLSSSASLQAALGMFLLGASIVPGASADLDDVGRMRLAQTLQRSENAYVGVASGLLDQFSATFGRAGHALMLDCRSLAYERLPLGDPPPAIVVCDSKTSRQLADGMYNRRRAECETVVSHFQARRGAGSVKWLRDVTLNDLESAWDDLDPIGRLRARHVLTENARVAAGAEALKAGDVAAFGRLMSASHASSRDDFANSSPALDALIEAAAEAPGFLGGKLSGAGWAGCTVNLVEARDAESFAEAVAGRYHRRTGIVPDVHICRAADGASAWAV